MERSLAMLRTGANDLVRVLRELQAAEAAIKSDVYLSDFAKKEKLTEARATARRRYDALTASLHEAERAARAGIAEAFAEVGTTEDRLLALMEEERAWRRAQPVLERADSLMAGVETLVQGADAALLRALRGELPAYALARELPEGVDGALEVVRRAEEPFLTTSQRAARAAEQELARGWPRLQVGIAHAGAILDGKFDMTAPIASFDGSVEHV